MVDEEIFGLPFDPQLQTCGRGQKWTLSHSTACHDPATILPYVRNQQKYALSHLTVYRNSRPRNDYLKKDPNTAFCPEILFVGIEKCDIPPQFDQLSIKGNFDRVDVVTALTTHKGNVDLAFQELNGLQRQQFLHQVWDKQPDPEEVQPLLPETETNVDMEVRQ